MKQQQTTQSASWVSPQPLVIEQPSAKPTHKGEISTGRILGFLLLSFVVAIAVSYLTWSAWGVNVALAVFVLVLLSTFSPFYLMDSMLSSGYLHRRSELSIDSARVDLEIIRASNVNAEQQEQIEQLWDSIHALDERIKALSTVRITGKGGARDIPKFDDIDGNIDRWIATLFDANGKMVGAHASGSLKAAYPFKGDSDEAQQAHMRLIRAGLVGRNEVSKQFTWIGPPMLSETRTRLQKARDTYLG